MELLRPVNAASLALPRFFSPKVIIRDGKGCFGSRPLHSACPDPLSGTSAGLLSGTGYASPRLSPVLLDLSNSTGSRFRDKTDQNKGSFSSPNDCSLCQKTNYACPNYKLNAGKDYDNVREPSVNERSRETGTRKHCQDTVVEELSPLKHSNHQCDELPSWHDQKHTGNHQILWGTSRQTFNIGASRNSSAESGDRVVCAGTWIPPQVPRQQPSPATSPPSPSPTKSVHGGPPGLLFCCPSTGHTARTQTICLAKTSHEADTPGVPESAYYECGRSPKSASSPTQHDAVDSITKECRCCEACSLNRTAPRFNRDFSVGTSGHLSLGCDESSVMPASHESFYRRFQTDFAPEHLNCSCALSKVPKTCRSPLHRNSDRWEVSRDPDVPRNPDYEISHTRDTDSVCAKMPPGNCLIRGRDYSYDMLSGTLNTDPRLFFQLPGDCRQKDLHNGREFHCEGPFCEGRPRTPSGMSLSSDAVSNDKHSTHYPSDTLGYHGIWTVIKAKDIASSVHFFAGEETAQTYFEASVSNLTCNSSDTTNRTGKPCMGEQTRSPKPNPDTQNGHMNHPSEEMMKGQRYSPGMIHPLSFLSNACSNVQQCNEEPYDLSTKTKESAGKVKHDVNADVTCDDNAKCSLTTDQKPYSNVIHEPPVHSDVCDLTAKQGDNRLICHKHGCQLCPESQVNRISNGCSVSATPICCNPSLLPGIRVPTSNPHLHELSAGCSERLARPDDVTNLMGYSYAKNPYPPHTWSNADYQTVEHSYYSIPNSWSQYTSAAGTNHSANARQSPTLCSNDASQTPAMFSSVAPFPANTCPQFAPASNAGASQTFSHLAAGLRFNGIMTGTAASHAGSETKTTPLCATALAASDTRNQEAHSLPVPEFQSSPGELETDRPSRIVPVLTELSTASAVVVAQNQHPNVPAAGSDDSADYDKQHVRSGSGKKRRARLKTFRCSLCSVACSNRGQLQGHLRTHTGERPFPCREPGCNKTFVRNEELTRHRRIHSGERPYSCVTCGKAFTRKDHLNKHVRMHADPAFQTAQPMELA